MSRLPFYKLIRKVRSDSQRNSQKAINSSGSVETMVAVAIRWLAGGFVGVIWTGKLYTLLSTLEQDSQFSPVQHAAERGARVRHDNIRCYHAS